MRQLPLIEDLLHLFFPATCAGCEAPLLRNEKLFCTACSFDLPYTRMHDEGDNQLERRFWGKCPLLAATALFHFVPGGKVQNALYRVKYHADRETGIALGKLLGYELSRSQRFQGIRSLVHVPLHPEKLKSRGFDQASLIAEGVSWSLGVPHYPDLLQRVSATDSQTKRGRYERWKNVSGAFRLNPTAPSINPPVLIVDDVLTTGSTLEACAHLLLREGHGPVAVATIASA